MVTHTFSVVYYLLYINWLVLCERGWQKKNRMYIKAASIRNSLTHTSFRARVHADDFLKWQNSTFSCCFAWKLCTNVGVVIALSNERTKNGWSEIIWRAFCFLLVFAWAFSGRNIFLSALRRRLDDPNASAQYWAREKCDAVINNDNNNNDTTEFWTR